MVGRAKARAGRRSVLGRFGLRRRYFAAAASIYFGVTDLSKLTPAQAMLLASLPQSPTTYDPYLFAKPDAKGRLVVPTSAPIIARRNYLLNALSTSRWTRLTPPRAPPIRGASCTTHQECGSATRARSPPPRA